MTMATLQIENLPEDLYQTIQKLAASANVSLNEVVIQMLAQAAPPTQITTQQQEQMEKTSEALARIRSRPRINPAESDLPDSTLMIRADRDR